MKIIARVCYEKILGNYDVKPSNAEHVKLISQEDYSYCKYLNTGGGGNTLMHNAD